MNKAKGDKKNSLELLFLIFFLLINLTITVHSKYTYTIEIYRCVDKYYQRTEIHFCIQCFTSNHCTPTFRNHLDLIMNFFNQAASLMIPSDQIFRNNSENIAVSTDTGITFLSEKC